MRAAAAIAAVLAALALAACGGGDEDAAGPGTVTVTEEAPAATAPPAPGPTAPGTTTGRDTTTAPGAAPAPRARGRTYRAGEAGQVTLAREGDRLRLVRVSPAPGWTHRVDERERREIEVTFRRGGREVEFEAELEDGRIVTSVDTDD